MQQKKVPIGKHSEIHQWRSSYSDHSAKFQDWVDHLGIGRTWFGRFIAKFETKFGVRKFSFVFLFSLVLAYVLNFEIRNIAHYQVGEIAKSDVFSPVSFEMVDETTTEEKKIRAEDGIPTILDFDPYQFEKVSGSIYRSFRLMRSELKNIKWPKSAAAREEAVKDFFSHKSEFEKELGVAVPDYLYEWLTEMNFGASLENIIIRNLKNWYEEKVLESPDKVFPADKAMAIGRVVSKLGKGREFIIQKKEVTDSSAIEKFTLGDQKGLKSVTAASRNNLLAFSRLLIYPNLTVNKQELASRKQAARSSVLPVTLSIKKNQTIISEGTVIQPFHLAILAEIDALRSDRRKDIVTIATGLFFFSLIIVFFQYLRRFSGIRVKVDAKDVLLMGVVTLTMVLIIKLFWFFTATAFVAKFGSWLPSTLFLFAAPVAAGPMLVGLVITSGEVVWLFTAFTAIVMGMTTELNFSFMMVTLAGGIAAARGVYACKKRNDIYMAGIRAGIVNAIVITLIITITKVEQEGFVREMLLSIPAGFLGGVTSSLVAMMLIPALESVFNYTTDVKLLELSNLNHPLLKEMIVKAPGTYHHSMMVGSMVEAAAEEIGANPLLGKVMCYYHDIGKMEHSNYFIENQKPGQNPHDHISPYMSKTLLVAHIKDGVEMGMQHKLGKPIIDGIVQHHGTTLISFFFNKALDGKAENGPEVAEEEFCYPGPKPQFREAALCMLADSIEAAARSLDEPTPTRLQNIVKNIVQRKFMDGQLDDCNLTLKDLSKVENAFIRILYGIYHQRVDYPKHAGGGAAEAPSASFSGTGSATGGGAGSGSGAKS